MYYILRIILYIALYCTLYHIVQYYHLHFILLDCDSQTFRSKGFYAKLDWTYNSYWTALSLTVLELISFKPFLKVQLTQRLLIVLQYTLPLAEVKIVRVSVSRDCSRMGCYNCNATCHTFQFPPMLPRWIRDVNNIHCKCWSMIICSVIAT